MYIYSGQGLRWEHGQGILYCFFIKERASSGLREIKPYSGGIDFSRQKLIVGEPRHFQSTERVAKVW